jgi:hypothetical protein
MIPNAVPVIFFLTTSEMAGMRQFAYKENAMPIKTRPEIAPF